MLRHCEDCGVELNKETPLEFTKCDSCYKKAINVLVPNLSHETNEDTQV